MARTAVIAGVGPGLGASLVRKFCREGCRVGMLARSEAYLKDLTSEVEKENFPLLGVPTDITDPGQVSRGFNRVREAFGPVDILVNHASASAWKGLLDLTLEEFERAWRVTVYGGFLCSREVVPDMLKSGGGVILFTGATSSVRGREKALAFSSAKFGFRGLAESMAREFWPKGIHVAHVVVDGVIDTSEVRKAYAPGPEEPLLDPDAMATSYWGLVEQDKSAWTLELDLRPHSEAFFE